MSQTTKKSLVAAVKSNTQAQKVAQKAPAQKQVAKVEDPFVNKNEQKAPERKMPVLKSDIFEDNSKWYMSRENDLEKVTNESSNLDIGIENIRPFPPREDQLSYGVIMNLSIKLAVGVTLRDISVRIDENNRLFLRYPFRMERREEGANNYYDSVSLTRVLQAQLLSFVDNCIDWTSVE